jgi:hypothetical protein
VLSDAVAGQKRLVRLRLAPNGAYDVVLRIPIGAGAESVSVNGAPATFARPAPDDDYAIISCSGRACGDGLVEITLAANGARDKPWYISGSVLGATPATASIAASRPNWAVPIQLGDTALTFKRLPL